MSVQFLIRYTDTGVLEDKPKIQRGDIVVQCPGGTITEPVSNPNLRKAEINDKNIEDMTGLATMKEYEDQSVEVEEGVFEDRPVLVKKRKYYLDIDSLPQNLKDDLENNSISVPYNTAMQYFKERV